jgi:hypothetical protein
MLFKREHGGDGIIVAASPRRLNALHLKKGRLKTAVRNAMWWLFASQGITAVEIAEFYGLPERTVQNGITSAERLRKVMVSVEHESPESIPFFGCQPWSRVLTEFRDHPDPRNVNEDGEAICPTCGGKIEPCNIRVCMCCDASGYDLWLSEQLGRAVLAGTAPEPEPESTQHRASQSSAEARPRILSQAHRAEIAETPQGRMFLKAIGQLPSAKAVAHRAARRKRQSGNAPQRPRSTRSSKRGE